MSVLFTAVRWKNFLSTGNAFTEVLLDKNQTTLIVGTNGAGKSTMLDAICFGLYNKPFRKINKPQLVNAINNKECVVEVEFVSGSDQYKVMRGIKPAIFEISKNGKLLDQSAANCDYQQMLENTILKMNHRSFCQVVILGSSNYIPFMRLTAFQRRQIVEDLLDIQIFTRMNLLLKERISKNKEACSEIKHQISILQERQTMQNRLISSLTAGSEGQLQRLEANLADVVVQIQQADEEVEHLIEESKQLEAWPETVSNLRQKLTKAVAVGHQLEDRKLRLEREANFFHDAETCPTCKQGIAHDFKIEMLSQKETSLAKLVEDKKVYERRYEELLTALGNAEKQAKEYDILLASQSSTVKTRNLLIKQKSAILSDIAKAKSESKATVSEELTKLRQVEEAIGVETLKLEKELSHADLLQAASLMLKDGGIKARIIKQYVPIMNKLINKYLASMDFFVQFELDEQFNETIRSRFRDEFSYNSFSEGEKMRIDLAILFAWRTIAKMRNSASSNLLILDEVMDSSLDSVGTDEFLRIVDTLASDTNTFVISHKGDALFDRFDHFIRFEKVGNFSRMAA